MSSAAPTQQNMLPSKNIPVRRVVVNDPGQLPLDYGTTPGGTIFSTTPGGRPNAIEVFNLFVTLLYYVSRYMHCKWRTVQVPGYCWFTVNAWDGKSRASMAAEWKMAEYLTFLCFLVRVGIVWCDSYNACNENNMPSTRTNIASGYLVNHCGANQEKSKMFTFS